ncbi:hypothetical protein [Neisseria sicca]|uniref:hypothetical protein n=1 Tax=Neisseria sicca TaxID=490 RepID=UPI0016498354|nr:hypothetical protein [Neisseria sicca]
MRTAHTLHVGFKFRPPAGSLCGVATHAVDGNAGYACCKINICFQAAFLIQSIHAFQSD